MSPSILARKIRRQTAEVRSLEALFNDSEWFLENRSRFVPLLAYALGRINELDYFKSLIPQKSARTQGGTAVSASALIEKFGAQREIVKCIENQIDNSLQSSERLPGEVFEDLYDAYDLFFISQALGDQYHERLTQVISEVLAYLEGRDSEERRKFERSILNLKSSNLCFSGAHRAFSRNPSKLFSPLLPISAAAVSQSHETILNRVFEYYDRDSAESRFTVNFSSILRRLIELSQQEGEKVIQTIRSFSNLLFEEYESITVIPSDDEPVPNSSTVIIATTPRYRGPGSPSSVLLSLNELLLKSKVDNLTVLILSNQSGLETIRNSHNFHEIESFLRSEKRGILIPLAVKRYQLDFVPIN